MAGLPPSEDSLLIRTDFEDDSAWLELRAEVEEENADGFAAYVEAVDDRAWAGVPWTELQRAVMAEAPHAEVLFAADSQAFTSDYPIQVVDLSGDGREPFRCAARELWGVDNNLNLANMDWDEFADAVGPDGVFHGFE
ncbi:MAG: hypothetical protein LBK95_04450 [Bifidobacteriaceae bacterium]|jgi:hypothetical protein|nr:hypothetical protein [Bifidobacteriaceae bacterium]